MSRKNKIQTLLEKVCNTLGTQGGVMAEYARDYFEVRSCFGDWHKHCPQGMVLCYGLTLDTREEIAVVTDVKYYEEWRKKCNYETTLFLMPIKTSYKILVEHALNDRTPCKL